MWSRKRVAAQRQEQLQQRAGEEGGEEGRQRAAGEEVAHQGKDFLRSQAVQVSPEHMTRRTRRGADTTAAEAAVQVDVRSFNASSDQPDGAGDGAEGGNSASEEESAVARIEKGPRGGGGGRGGGRGRGGSRMMWRWASSRRFEPKSESGDADVHGGSTRNGSGSGGGGGGGRSSGEVGKRGGSSSYSPSPSRLSLRRRGRDVTAATAAVADTPATATAPPATTAAATAATEGIAAPRGVCLRRRSTFPRRGFPSEHPSANLSSADSVNNDSLDLPAVAADHGSAAAATAAAVAAAAAASLVLSSLDDRNKTPERLVASMLLHKGAGNGDGAVPEPVSPATSISSDSGSAPSWGERVGLSGGVAVVAASRAAAASAAAAAAAEGDGRQRARIEGSIGERRRKSPLGNECPLKDADWPTSKNNGNREVPRFLRPVIVLLTLSLLAIGGARILQAVRGGAGGEGWVGGGRLLFGPAAYAAGGIQLPEAVVDDIFERADKDNDGVIGDEEIQYLVERAGGSLLDDASEIEAGVASVMKNLDRNEDRALSRSDLNTYWDRLGTLLTVDEAAQWVLHAAQLPQEVADAFVNNMVTGYDFPELAARQGALLEQDLGVTRPAFKRTLVRSMQWKLWGMGQEPAAPTGLRAANASCGALSLEWDQTTPGNRELSFPVHKYVLRRARLGPEGERDGDWTTVMAAAGGGGFFDAGLQPGAAYRYALQAWNALGHSGSVEIDVVVEDCSRPPGGPWYSLPPGDPEASSIGGLVVATVMSAAAALCCRTLSGSVGGGDVGGWGGGGGGERKRARTSGRSLPAPAERRRRPDPIPAVTGTAEKASAAASDGEGAESGGRAGLPVSVKSNGSGRSGGDGGVERDRDRFETRRRLSGPGNSRPSTSASSRFATSSSSSLSSSSSKERLRRSDSDVAPTARVAPSSSKSVGNLGHGRAQGGGGVGGGGGGGGGGAAISAAAIGDSVRRERARRMASRHSSSRDEKDVCKECGKEWRWYRPAKHTCCKCHDKFCDRKECGWACHSFGACPVGGTCKCRSCELLDEGRRASSSPAMSFDR